MAISVIFNVIPYKNFLIKTVMQHTGYVCEKSSHFSLKHDLCSIKRYQKYFIEVPICGRFLNLIVFTEIIILTNAGATSATYLNRLYFLPYRTERDFTKTLPKLFN